MKRFKKVLLIVLCVLLVIVLAAGTAVAVIWRDEISAYKSITKLSGRDDSNNEGSLWYVEVPGDYYFTEFLETGARSDSELIAFMTNHLTKGLISAGISETDLGCSSFTAALANGDRVMGRNYDMRKTNSIIVRTEASGDRHATLSTSDLNFLGLDTDTDPSGLMDKLTMTLAVYAPLDGMNDAGVSLSIHMSYQGTTVDEDGNTRTIATDINTEKPDITSTTMIRLVLDYADDLDEAIELISQYDLHDSANTSYHYIIADASGRSAILEWVNGTNADDNDAGARQLVVTYADDDAAIGEAEAALPSSQWMTNYIIQPGYYADEADMKGLARYRAIGGQLTAANGVLADEQAAMDVLSSVGRRSFMDDQGVTVHSVVYDLTQRTATWVSNEHYGEEAETFTYSLK